MKYQYNTVTGPVVIDVDEKWFDILTEYDRQEYNNNHTETRRHSTLDNGKDDGEWLAYEDKNIEALFSEPTLEEKLKVALSKLSDEQQRIIDALFFQGKTQTEYAKELGVTQGAISQRLSVIIRKLKKILEKT